MPATGKFIHNARHLVNIGTTASFVPGSQRQVTNFWEVGDSIKTSASSVSCRISALYVRVDTIAAGATSLTIRLTRDAAGNDIIIPDTSSAFSTGITTATTGGVVFKVDVDYKHTDSIAFLHFRTNLGTCAVREIQLLWEE